MSVALTGRDQRAWLGVCPAEWWGQEVRALSEFTLFCGEV